MTIHDLLQPSIAIWIAVGLACLGILAILARPRHEVVARPLMTRAEIVFHRKLKAACAMIGGYEVYPQVAMSAILRPRPGLSRDKSLWTHRRHAQKVIDFVIADENANICLIVELDDHTHIAARDSQRDWMTRSAGYRTLRIRSQGKWSPTALSQAIIKSMK